MNADNLTIIALGSNVGDSQSILLRAMERLAGLSSRPLLKSSLWQTTPVNCPPGSPMFLNAVVGLVAPLTETPESLLEKLLQIEKEFGRKSTNTPNEPRRLDLDLIAFGRATRTSKDLTLPHPRAHERQFVLQPLSEIAPALILPGQRRTVAELLAALHTGEKLVHLNV
jgi:2-amino-4-hydroxy-6-hydroxymethyldihydropteridine diphosphokinase